MQLAGPWAVNAPPDRASAIGVLRAAVTAGIDHIDTAQYYGPDVVNDLIREALHPYPPELAIVSKVGVFRDTGRDARQLRQGIEDNLRSLRVGQLAAVNLRLPSPGRPDARFDDQLAALVRARDEGLIAGVGLSNVSLDQLRHAAERTEIACVQNLFHLADRSAAPVLAECLRRGIAFVPFCPLGLPRGPANPVLTSPVVIQTAARLGATPPQVALQWLLQLAPNVLLIPGTGSTAHLLDNLAAEHLALDDQALRELAGVGA
jgi:aryl-alcohol dehydrogenase-like predicted oxidoreductase